MKGTSTQTTSGAQKKGTDFQRLRRMRDEDINIFRAIWNRLWPAGRIAVLPILLLLAAWLPQQSGTGVSLRGMKALPGGSVWASGTKGTFLRTTNGGKDWQVGTVPNAESLDFRAVEAIDENTAWLMSAGEGAKSRIFKTTDAGKTWKLQFTNTDAKGFWDGLRFWDAQHGILLGDPVGGRFVIFTTMDGGAAWQRQSSPAAFPEEGAFAASNTSLALHGKSAVWFGTGGPSGARVFHSADGGQTWQVSATPIRNGASTAGIFSLVFLNSRYGIAVGGDYAKPNDAARNIAITTDGGYTWAEPLSRPAGYRSAIAFNPRDKLLVAVGTSGSDMSFDYGKTWKPSGAIGFNAAAFTQDGRGWAVGPEGGVAWSAPAEESIRRLDGSRISIAEADAFAKRTLEAAHVTGAQIAIVDGGKLVWSAAYGLRRRDPALPMERDTTTWAASITKSVFATYVMQLVERGEFSLDEPLARQLAKPLNEYEAYRETGSELVRDAAWLSVTPRMLLAHTSGLLNFAFLEPDKKLHLHFKPGSEFRYSGDGINLVQFAVEQKKGKPLDQLMQDAIFAPLGMKRTGMIYRKEFEDNVADRYDANEKFISQTRRFPARASGNMTSSAEDLTRFASALFEGKILRGSTRTAMLRPFFRINSLHQFAVRRDEGEGKEAKDAGLAYGVGWGLLTHTRFGPAFFKEGHGDGAQNYMICFERRKACMILLTNSDNGELAFRSLLEKIWGETVTPWEWEGYTPAYIEASRKNQ